MKLIVLKDDFEFRDQQFLTDFFGKFRPFKIVIQKTKLMIKRMHNPPQRKSNDRNLVGGLKWVVLEEYDFKIKFCQF